MTANDKLQKENKKLQVERDDLLGVITRAGLMNAANDAMKKSFREDVQQLQAENKKLKEEYKLSSLRCVTIVAKKRATSLKQSAIISTLEAENKRLSKELKHMYDQAISYSEELTISLKALVNKNERTTQSEVTE